MEDIDTGYTLETQDEDNENDETEDTLSDEMEQALSRMPALGGLDLDEEKIVSDFVESGCGCQKYKNNSCSNQFSYSYYLSFRSMCKELSPRELDMAILGQLAALANNDEIVSIEGRHIPSECIRLHCDYTHKSKPVCLRTFLFLHAMGIKRMKNLMKSYQQNGMQTRVHGNTKRLPAHSLSLESIQHVVKFLLNYTEENGLLLPGRVPGYKRSDVKLLPSSTSKRGIWKKYTDATEGDVTVHSVAYSTFCRLWKVLLPSIILMQPMTDLCWQCQKNSSTILRAANSPEQEKSVALSNALEHLKIVKVERSFYNSTCEECRREIRAAFTEEGEFVPPPLSSRTPANSRQVKVHYSFDYAQQVIFLFYMQHF